MNRALFPNRPASFMRGIALIASFFFLPISVSAFTPDASVGTGYDDYLLATQKAGESLAQGITAGVENTAQLYRLAWNELISQGSTLRLPKVEPLLASYTQFSNSLGQTFAQTFIAGLGASQEFSQKIWDTDPYGKYASFAQDTGTSIGETIATTVGKLSAVASWGESVSKNFTQGIRAGKNNTITLFANVSDALDPSSYLSFGNDMGEALADNIIRYVSVSNSTGELIAEGIRGGFKNSATLYADSFAKTKQLVQKTPNLKLAINTDGVATISDIWNSTTNYFSNLWNNLTEPRPLLKTAPQGEALAPKQTPPKPVATPVAPKPVATPKQPATNNQPLTPKPTSNPITKTPTAPPQQLVVERTVERILSGLTSADLELKIQQLRNELVSKIGAVAGQTQSNYSNNFAAIALTNKIDQLTNTVITTPAITGGTITNASISGGSISGTTISGTTLTVSSGTFSGNLTVSGTATSTFAGDSAFDSGTLYIDSLNNRVGVGTTSPSDTFALAGPLYLSQISAPSVTTNRLYNVAGALTWNGTALGAGGGTSSWATTTSTVAGQLINYPTNAITDIVVIGSSATTSAPFFFDPNITTGYISGKLGIGTTSPYAKLSVVGETVSSYFTATSTTASTFPYASTTALTVSGSLYTPLTANSVPFIGTSGLLTQNTNQFVWDNTNARLGIGTTSPYAKLSVVGEVVATNFTATSTTATTTLAGGLNVGSGKFSVLQNGNVGVGTTNPRHLLQIGNGDGTPNLSEVQTLFTNTGLNGISVRNSSNNVEVFLLAANPDAEFGTLTNSNLRISTNNTTRMMIDTSGNVGIGTTSPYAKLSVVGETVSSYFTATSTTATSTFNGGLAVGTGVSPSGLVYDRSTGRVGIGTAAPSALFTVNSTAPFTVTSTGAITGGADVTSVIGAVAFSGFGGIYGNAGTLNLGSNSSDIIIYPQNHTETSGTVEPILIGNGASFAPTSGTGVYNFMSLNPVINQTGGANGVTRGIYINPTLTSASDFRAIETMKGNVVFGSTSGNVGIGTTSPYAKLSVVGETVSSYFTATSTTATSTFGGAMGIGTTSPNAKLAIQGVTDTTQNLFNIASSTGASLVSVDSGGGLIVNRGTMSAAGNTLFSVSGTRVVGDGSNDILSPTAGLNASLSVTPTVTEADFFGNTLSTNYTAPTVGYTGGIIGSKNTATVNVGSPNTVNGAYGSYNVAYLQNNGTLTNAVGNLGRVYSVTGTITNAYGFRSLVSPASATNAYGLYVNTISGATNSYAIYTVGANDKSYFGGNVGIGTTTQNNKLDIYSTTKPAIGFSGASGDTYKWTIGMDVSNGGKFSIASSTALGTLDRFIIDGNGNVGIGTTSPSAMLHVGSAASGGNVRVSNGWLCVDNNDTCTGAATAGTVYAVGAYTTGADLAENYQAFEEGLTPGDIVSVTDTQTISTTTVDSFGVKKAIHGETAIGIVSIKPGLLLASSLLENIPVALQGRVPVKVNGEGGSIKVGDRITLSSAPGIGMKATSSAYTVGIALEDFTSSATSTTGSILTFVNLSWSHLDPAIAEGTILDGNGESSFWSVEDVTGRIKFISAGIDLNDQDIISVRAIIGSAGKWSIDANGRLVVGEVEADKITTKTLCIDDVCIEKEALRALINQQPTTNNEPPASDITTADNAEPISIPEPKPAPTTVPEPQPESTPVSTPAPESIPEPTILPIESVPVPEPTPESTPEPQTESAPTAGSTSAEPSKIQGEVLENSDLAI